MPAAGRAFVIEKLLESLSGEFDAGVERAHLVEIRRRRVTVRSGATILIEGNAALRQARAALKR